MKQSDYVSISGYIIQNIREPLPTIMKELLQKYQFKFSSDTLLSICLFHYQLHTKQLCSGKALDQKFINSVKLYIEKLQKSQESNDKLVIGEIIKKQSLLTLSKEHAMPPSVFARILLKQYLENTKEDLGSSHIKTELVQLMKYPFNITNQVLSRDVRQCLLNDFTNGLITDAIRHMVGLEFEQKLLNHVMISNICYQNENALRKLGYDKTPDVKLDIPICVKGHIVCWIESKASFGSSEAHQTYLNEQYYSYWNRFGPGLVIYWYGFVEELIEESIKYEILLMDNFPSNSDIVLFNPKQR